MTRGDGGAGRPDESLEGKYGAALFDDPPAMTPDRLRERLAELDGLDQHFARTTFDFLGGMQRRRVLDARTRLLVQVGQFAVTRSLDHLEDAIRAAVLAGVPIRESLESILLCQVYAGDTAVRPALKVFVRVADDLGVLDGLGHDQLPLDGRDRERDLRSERDLWQADAADDPRREPLMERHGWVGISTGMRYRGAHHLRLLEHRDALDPEWADLWLRFTYQGMYSRWILDDTTRIICTVGDTLAVGDFVQARDHMVEALKIGIPARELMEVVFLIGPYFGSPRMAAALRLLEDILADQGRSDEIKHAATSTKKGTDG